MFPARRALATLGLLAAACGGQPPADLLIFGTVWTGDSVTPAAEGVAVREGRIVALGDSAGLEPFRGPATEIIRAPGLVVPGLIDDHVHLTMTGRWLDAVDLRDAATPAEFARRLGDFARKLAPGEWIVGGGWDHERWAGTPLPDRAWIDSLTPDTPMLVNRLDGHMALANTAALRAAGVDRSVGAVLGGEIVRRPDGELTGVFKDAAQDLIVRAIPPRSPAQLDADVARFLEHAASLGVTSVASVSASWPDVAALRRARARGALTLRVANFLPVAEWAAAAESLRVSGPGDDWIRVAGVKGLIDGSLGSTTAFFDQPYTDAPSTSGFLTIPEDSARRWITAADSAGLQVVIHAIGDRANGLVLDLFEEAAARNGARDRRFRIEHAQHIRPADIPRFAALGVVPSMQPYHAADDGRWAERRIGPVRIRTTYPFRSLLDAGARLVFGSDTPVAPVDPMLGIAAAVTRRTIDGAGVFVPAERITVEEALRAYTVDNAWSMYFDGVTGRLATGLAADLVVLDRNLLTMPADSLAAARVLVTIAGGRIVYRRP